MNRAPPPSVQVANRRSTTATLRDIGRHPPDSSRRPVDPGPRRASPVLGSRHTRRATGRSDPRGPEGEPEGEPSVSARSPATSTAERRGEARETADLAQASLRDSGREEPRVHPDGDGPLNITVAICTHDRAGLLEQTLGSLTDLEVPDDVSWEVLVVANACSDRTPRVLDSFRHRLPLRDVEEPRRGHSHARNRAVDAAEGDYLIWTDDDVRVDPGWVGAYARAFRRWPEAAFYGGPIRPVFQGVPPRWLTEAFESFEEIRAAYASRDLGSEPVAIETMDDLPYGANMALPLEIQVRERYDPRLGRSGSDLVGGDELAVLGALLDQGERGRWVPDAALEHLVPEDRQSADYLRRYFRDQGRVAEPLPEDMPVPELFGRPRWALRALVVEGVSYGLKRLTGSPPDWIPHLIESSFAYGALLGPPPESERRG